MNWEYNAATSKSGEFLKHTEDNLMSQVLSEPSRKGASLNVLFENRENLVGEVTISVCLGHNDKENVNFKIFENISAELPLDFKRTNLKLLGDLGSSLP